MILREITVGRSKDCDIYLDPRCQFASSYHATIYMDGNQLMYRDRSTNGTMINNVSVHNRAVPINYGDIIMLAGKYQLNWNQIMPYFPQGCQQPAYQQPTYNNVASPTHVEDTTAEYVDTSRWNWGAFCLFPIWGFFNGCWWAFLVGMFGFWLSPITNIVFGIYGTRWAWENKEWSSVAAFEESLKSWNTAGVVVLCINVFVLFFYFAFIISMVS